MVKLPTIRRAKQVDEIETYEKRVKRLYEGRNNLPVIKKGSPEWEAWMGYFKYIGHNHAKHSSFANIRGQMTVPEKDPDKFDPGFHCSNRQDGDSKTDSW